ncbi:MAG TPA: hypothetical protein VFX39_07925 [Gemmatimonadaceae bacterium]|nr:hypothetical protein [Gemmatimonadaceae bacterium]
MGRKQDDPRGKQKGAQEHAEGQHGAKAHSRFLEEIQASTPDRDELAGGGDTRQHPPDGGHRLFERREQHDPADEASDKNRLGRDIDAHGHVRENFQVRGGAASHPELPSRHIDPENPDRRR